MHKTIHTSAFPRLQVEAKNTMQIVDLLLISFLTFLSGSLLNVEVHEAFVALVGSVCGALTFSYLRRETLVKEQLAKIGVSTIAGFFVGSFMMAFYGVEKPAFIGSIYFASSFFSLVILRSAIWVVENNATSLIKRCLDTFVSVRLADEENKPVKKVKPNRGEIA